MENTDLTRVQREGINDYGLTEEQVQIPNYGAHTLEAIDRLQYENNELGTREAFNQVAGLNRSQLEGLLSYNLTRQEIQSSNFGRHSLNAVDHLRQLHPNTYPTNRTAFNLIRDLDEIQVNGVLYYDLTRAQVQSPNFNEQTLETIDDLMRANQRRFQNPGIIFDEINNLNATQVEGIRDYNLTRTQVTTPNFGTHTLDAMHHLIQENTAQNRNSQGALNLIRGLNDMQIEDITTARLQRAAFDVVKGLNEIQINALINFRLRGRHVLDARLNENVLLNVQVLNQHYPDMRNEDLADITMNQLLEYQVRGLNLGLSPEQLSFSIEGNQLVNLENATNPGKTVDVVTNLIQSENMPAQQAFQAAQSLNTEQTSALLNFGLRLAQIQNTAFTGDETIAAIYSAIENDEELGELEIPLNEKQQQLARELMDDKISRHQEQEITYPAAATIPDLNDADLSSNDERDLAALATAMQIKEGIGKPSSSKKDVKQNKNNDKKKGPRP